MRSESMQAGPACLVYIRKLAKSKMSNFNTSQDKANPQPLIRSAYRSVKFFLIFVKALSCLKKPIDRRNISADLTASDMQ